MSLNSVLQKRKKRKEMDNDNIRAFIFDTVNELTEKKFNEQFGKLKEKTENEIKDQTDLVLGAVKDGDKGDKGDSIKGEKGEKGERGDSPTKTFLSSLIRPLIPKPKIGKQGIKGESIKGDSGSPDKPKEIVKKLNTLENTLDVKVLKGLKPILKSIQDSIRSMKKGGGMGGGMGMPIHDQFDGDGSTTVFTLSYNVAASGNAVMACRYQGQVQHLGDQYTISGKTLTFTFTPANGTKIEITYIRSS